MKTQYSLSVVATVAALVLAILLAPTQSASAFNAFFNFDSYAAGTPAEAISAPGIGMSSQFGSNGWQVTPAEKYATLSGNVLTNAACNDNLVIKLDAYYHTISLRFAAWGGATGVRVQGFSGDPNNGALITTQIHQGTQNGISEGVFEGVATDDIQGVSHILISDADGCVAIDDLRLDDLPVLEIEPVIIREPIIRLPLPQPRPTTIELEPIVIRGN